MTCVWNSYFALERNLRLSIIRIPVIVQVSNGEQLVMLLVRGESRKQSHDSIEWPNVMFIDLRPSVTPKATHKKALVINRLI